MTSRPDLCKVSDVHHGQTGGRGRALLGTVCGATFSVVRVCGRYGVAVRESSRPLCVHGYIYQFYKFRVSFISVNIMSIAIFLDIVKFSGNTSIIFLKRKSKVLLNPSYGGDIINEINSDTFA